MMRGIFMSKKKDYQSLANGIIELNGGEENIDNVIHCVTRLRFYIKDDIMPETEKIKELDGVMGVAEAGGQYQVVVGPAVDDIYKEVISRLSISGDQTSEYVQDPTRPEHKTLWGRMGHNFNKFIGVITGSVMPIINILAAAGIIK